MKADRWDGTAPLGGGLVVCVDVFCAMGTFGGNEAIACTLARIAAAPEIRVLLPVSDVGRVSVWFGWLNGLDVPPCRTLCETWAAFPSVDKGFYWVQRAAGDPLDIVYIYGVGPNGEVRAQPIGQHSTIVLGDHPDAWYRRVVTPEAPREK